MSSTTTSTTPNTVVRSGSTFTTLRWINTMAYLLNVAITYGIEVAGLLDLPTNAELSAKYQTVVTPAGWAFSIWGIIFLTQAAWVVAQWVGTTDATTTSSSSNISITTKAIGWYYLWTVLAQAGWTLAFSNELIPLSLVMMLSVLICLARIVGALAATTQKPVQSWTAYWLQIFPMRIHFGWIVAASFVNANVVLVAQYASPRIQLVAAMGTVVSLVAAAVATYLSRQWDATVPLVLAWALWGIYNELSNPRASIVQTFDAADIAHLRFDALVSMSFILVATIVRLTWQLVWKRGGLNSQQSEESVYLWAGDNRKISS